MVTGGPFSSLPRCPIGPRPAHAALIGEIRPPKGEVGVVVDTLMTGGDDGY